MTVVDIDDNLRLLGTAHISKASADAARREVTEYEPDIVAIEMCKSRLDALTRPARSDTETAGAGLRGAEAPADVAERLAPYKAPKSLESREEIPKNAVGKILGSALVAD